MSNRIPVPITGVGCLCAAGRSYRECMETIFSGIRNPSPPKRFSTQQPTAYPVFEIDDSLPGNPIKRSDIFLTSQMALASTLEALRDAGLTNKSLRSKRVGICVGTTVGSSMNSESFYREYRKGIHPDMSPIKQFLMSNPASFIAHEVGTIGPVQTIVNACSSGTDAIGIGASWIRAGICDVVVAGGADELCRTTYNGFISLMIYDDSPCKPFDKNRKGLNLGEGAGMLVLESDVSMYSRKKEARSYILGYGTASDAYHLTAPSPDGKGLKRAIVNALEESGLGSEDISFINAHGTGTPDNDEVESRVINELFSDIPFFSTKGYTGHTLGAAGAIEAVFTVGCLEQGRVPSNIGFTSHDPNLPNDPTKGEIKIDCRIAVSQSLAFGGQNAVLTIGDGRG